MRETRTLEFKENINSNSFLKGLTDTLVTY